LEEDGFVAVVVAAAIVFVVVAVVGPAETTVVAG
jgi:hypothetical protein